MSDKNEFMCPVFSRPYRGQFEAMCPLFKGCRITAPTREEALEAIAKKLDEITLPGERRVPSERFPWKVPPKSELALLMIVRHKEKPTPVLNIKPFVLASVPMRVDGVYCTIPVQGFSLMNNCTALRIGNTMLLFDNSGSTEAVSLRPVDRLNADERETAREFMLQCERTALKTPLQPWFPPECPEDLGAELAIWPRSSSNN